MHSMPEIYLWIKTGKYKYFFFFIISGYGLLSSYALHFSDDFFHLSAHWNGNHGYFERKVTNYKRSLLKFSFNRSFPYSKGLYYLVPLLYFLIVVCILPYWINKKKPYNTSSIPHGSQRNLLKSPHLDWCFFDSMGILLFFYPTFYIDIQQTLFVFWIFYNFVNNLRNRRYYTHSLMVLGKNAFNILTFRPFHFMGIYELYVWRFVYRFVEV
jgi:hypothetical protein